MEKLPVICCSLHPTVFRVFYSVHHRQPDIACVTKLVFAAVDSLLGGQPSVSLGTWERACKAFVIKDKSLQKALAEDNDLDELIRAAARTLDGACAGEKDGSIDVSEVDALFEPSRTFCECMLRPRRAPVMHGCAFLAASLTHLFHVLGAG